MRPREIHREVWSGFIVRVGEVGETMRIIIPTPDIIKMS
jgi:hypothetical protein